MFYPLFILHALFSVSLISAKFFQIYQYLSVLRCSLTLPCLIFSFFVSHHQPALLSIQPHTQHSGGSPAVWILPRRHYCKSWILSWILFLFIFNVIIYLIVTGPMGGCPCASAVLRVLWSTPGLILPPKSPKQWPDHSVVSVPYSFFQLLNNEILPLSANLLLLYS